MHHLDSNENHGEKARWELHKNTMNCFEQINYPTTLHETATVRPLATHLTKDDEQNMLGK